MNQAKNHSLKTAVFTVAELAARWRCSPDQVLALIRRGELAGFSISTASSQNCTF